jgi:hypothetical protein
MPESICTFISLQKIAGRRLTCLAVVFARDFGSKTGFFARLFVYFKALALNLEAERSCCFFFLCLQNKILNTL